MRAVMEVFKNELGKAYCENKRLQENLSSLLASCRQQAGAYPAYHAARCVLGALYRTANACDAVAWHVAKRWADDARRVADAFSWEVRLPQSLCRGALIRRVQEAVHKVDIPQHYGGVRSAVSPGGRRFVPRRTSAGHKNALFRKLAGLADGISNRILQERYIRCIEDEVIPYIFSNINDSRRIKEVSAEEQAEVLEGFRNILRKDASPGASAFFRVHCVDIRNVDSRVERDAERRCVTSKMSTRFALMYYEKRGVQKTAFVNYEFVLKFNHFFDEEHAPLLVDARFEPLRY